MEVDFASETSSLVDEENEDEEFDIDDFLNQGNVDVVAKKGDEKKEAEEQKIQMDCEGYLYKEMPKKNIIGLEK